MNKKKFAISVAKRAKEEAKKGMVRLIKAGMITTAMVKPYITSAMQEVNKQLNTIQKTARKEAAKELKKMKKKAKKKKKAVCKLCK